MSLCVGCIGIRDGEVITAAPKAKQCKGTTMKIRGNFPPIKSFMESLSDEDIRDKLNNYEFFAKKSKLERIDWLKNNCVEKEIYLEDIDDLYVKFVSIGGDFIMKNLSADTIRTLLAGNPDNDGYWLLQDVYNLFPRKPGSRAARHTLVFRPSNWDVIPDLKTNNSRSWAGLCVDLTGNFYTSNNQEILSPRNLMLLPIPDKIKPQNPGLKEIGLIYNDEIVDISFETILLLCAELGLDTNIMDNFSQLIDWFSPSTHKSLIQKILRTRASTIEHCGVFYPANEVLATTFGMLLVHPGSFVPNIQRYVSGLESACKRLAVSITEDAYIDNGAEILSLFCGAAIAQNNRMWKPPKEIIKKWIVTGLRSLYFNCMFQYSTKETGKKIEAWNPWYLSYYLLTSIKSFETDENLVYSIAKQNGRQSENVDVRNFERTMPLVHCIDQHCFTEIAHYYPYNLVKSLGSYENLFKQIWQEVTGINPRKSTHQNYDFVKGIGNFFKDTRIVQTLVWISKVSIISKSQNEQQSQNFYIRDYLLKDGWLSSFVGSHEIRVEKITTIVIIHPDDIYINMLL